MQLNIYNFTIYLTKWVLCIFFRNESWLFYLSHVLLSISGKLLAQFRLWHYKWCMKILHETLTRLSNLRMSSMKVIANRILWFVTWNNECLYWFQTLVHKHLLVNSLEIVLGSKLVLLCGYFHYYWIWKVIVNFVFVWVLNQVFSSYFKSACSESMLISQHIFWDCY